MRVRVISTEEQAGRNARFRASGLSRVDFERAEMEATGTVPFAYLPDGWFNWVCPGCAHPRAGQFGNEPVSGWEAPRWVNTGSHDRPTLTPSLGCPLWKRGECAGHWWLRDGELVAA